MPWTIRVTADGVAVKSEPPESSLSNEKKTDVSLVPLFNTLCIAEIKNSTSTIHVQLCDALRKDAYFGWKW